MFSRFIAVLKNVSLRITYKQFSGFLKKAAYFQNNYHALLKEVLGYILVCSY